MPCHISNEAIYDFFDNFPAFLKMPSRIFPGSFPKRILMLHKRLCKFIPGCPVRIDNS